MIKSWYQIPVSFTMKVERHKLSTIKILVKGKFPTLPRLDLLRSYTVKPHDSTIMSKAMPKGPAPATHNPPRIRLEIPAVKKPDGGHGPWKDYPCASLNLPANSAKDRVKNFLASSSRLSARGRQ